MEPEIPHSDLLGAVLERAPVILWVVDDDGVFQLSRGRALDVLGLQADEVVGRSVFDVYARIPDVIEAHRRSLRGETWNGTVAVGSTAFDVTCTPLEGPDGKVSGVMGVAVDVTSTRRAEAGLRRRVSDLSAVYKIDRATASELDLRSVLEVGLDAALEALEIEAGAVFLMDAEDQVLRVSAHRGLTDEFVAHLAEVSVGEGVTGTAVAERRAVVLDISQYPDTRLAPLVAAEGFTVLASVPLVSNENVLGAVTVSTASNRMLDEEDKALLTSVGIQLGGAVHRAQLYESVLQERAHLEDAVRDRTQELTEANESLRRLLSVVAHEIRNPLTAIGAFANRLVRAPGAAERERSHAEVIKRNADRLGRLIDDLLEASRFQQGTLTLNRAGIDLGEVLKEVETQLESEVSAKNQAVQVVLPSGGVVLTADRDRMVQVFSNLISNASKYSGDGSTIRCTVHHLGEDSCIDVSDHGIGISEEDVERLFQPFFRSNNPDAQREKGHGLGLSITRMLVEVHGGELSVESELGKGSTFHVRLPQRSRSK